MGVTMQIPSTEDVLDEALVQAVELAEDTYAFLDKYKDGPPEHLGDAAEQPGQREEDGTLRKVARLHIPGTLCLVDIHEEEVATMGDIIVSGWRVKILDLDGGVLYECDPGEFDLEAASATVPPPPGPE